MSADIVAAEVRALTELGLEPLRIEWARRWGAPPKLRSPELLRFTICRIAPAVVVMIEDEAARRQFRGLATVDAAVDFVCEVVAEATQAMADPHDEAGRTLH